jgi:hypothetical protein
MEIDRPDHTEVCGLSDGTGTTSLGSRRISGGFLSSTGVGEGNF